MPSVDSWLYSCISGQSFGKAAISPLQHQWRSTVLNPAQRIQHNLHCIQVETRFVKAIDCNDVFVIGAMPARGPVNCSIPMLSEGKEQWNVRRWSIRMDALD